LIRIDENATNLAVLVLGTTSGVYAVQKGQDYVFIDKFIASRNGFCIFACERVAIRNTNVVLALALTRRQTNFVITARVVDKADPNTVFFEHTVVDTPGADPTLSAAQFQALTGMNLLDLGPDSAEASRSSFLACVGVFQYTDGAAPAVLPTFDNFELWTYRVPTTRRVDAASANPAPPYDSWATAAQTLQDAVDAADPGDEIVVTKGTYATGGRAVYGTLTNRVAVDKPLTLRSVNGPQFTVIEGYQVPGTFNGDGAIRYVYLANGASLSGFTLTNVATRAEGYGSWEMCGGGVWSESLNVVLSSCVVTGNSAESEGGGV
jgi:hypothetical protein